MRHSLVMHELRCASSSGLGISFSPHAHSPKTYSSIVQSGRLTKTPSGGHAHTTSSYRAPLQLLLIALEARIDRKVLGAEPVHLLLTLLDLGSWAVQLDLVERRRRLE